MFNYRIHATATLGDRTDGREVLCEDDADAMALAASMARGYASVEVWLGPKLLGKTSDLSGRRKGGSDKIVATRG